MIKKIEEMLDESWDTLKEKPLKFGLIVLIIYWLVKKLHD